MMKILKKLFIGIGVILLLVGVSASGIVLNGTCFRKYEPGGSDMLRNWMSRVDDDALLNDVVMPGSHDAGTYTMSWLGKTQHLTMEQQLNSGVRYFDIRVNHEDGEYVIFHSILNGTEFDPILDAIRVFLTKETTETLLLDFQHFKNDAQKYVYGQICEKLAGLTVSNDTELSELEFVSQLKMKDVRGKCIVFFGAEALYTDDPAVFSRNNDKGSKVGSPLDSYYDEERNAQSSETFIRDHVPFYVGRIEEKIGKEGHKGVFVLQCQLTDRTQIFGPFSKEIRHEKNMEAYLAQLPNEAYFSRVNVIMRDFLDETKSEQIVQLNVRKGIMNDF